MFKISAAFSCGQAIAILCSLMLASSIPCASEEAKSEDVKARRWSLVFDLPSASSSSVGIWRVLSPRISMGIEIPFHLGQRTEKVNTTALLSELDRQGVRTEFDETSGSIEITELTAGLRTSLKRYLSPAGATRSFVLLNAFALFTGSNHDDPLRTLRISNGGQERIIDKTLNDLSSWKSEIGTQVGFGVDWFPSESVSIGGYAGFELAHLSTEDSENFSESQRGDAISSSLSSNSTIDSDGYQIGLYSSYIRVHFYF